MIPAWRLMTALASADGRVATKTHRWTGEGWETSGYSAGYQFRHWTRELYGLDDLAGGLERLAAQPDIFVIRGNVKPGAPQKIQRTYKADDSWIEDVDKLWLAVDIDGQPASPDRDHVAQAIELLPGWLQEADCVYRYSSSHGIKPANQLRLHLWYWLCRPIGNNALRHWARQWPIDGALYQPVQPHYTATPIFVGANDPVSRRIGYHRSSKREAEPPWDEPLLPSQGFESWERHEGERRREENAKRHVARMAVTPSTRKTPWDDQRRYERIVRAEIESVRTCPEGGRHDKIFFAARSVASFAAASSAAASAKRELEDAACASLPPSRHGEGIRRVDEGWRAGLASPRQLPPLVIDDDVDSTFAALWPDPEPTPLTETMSYEEYRRWKSGRI